MRRAASLVASILMLVATRTAVAQSTDPDLLLLASQAGAPPNVMILFDTSGSMQHATWHEGFDPNVFYDAASPCTATVYEKAGSAGQCPGSGRAGDTCPDNEVSSFFFGQPIQGLASGTTVSCTQASFVADCGDIPAEFACSASGGTLQITVPDVDYVNDVDPSDGAVIDEPDGEVLWAPNYVHWFMTELATTGVFPTVPFENRKMTSKRVLKDLINDLNPTQPDASVQQKVRFGLTRMHYSGGFFGTSNGGYVVEPIADDNKAALLATLRSSAINADGFTPLSESLVDIARYYVGDLLNPGGTTGLGAYSEYDRSTTDGSTTASAPGSPIDPNVLCRFNYVIVVTDGSPTQDANDHHGTDFASTFGADYDGDGDSNNAADANDTLDDVAAYLFQEDLVDDTVMPGKQNIVTYTVGFALDLPLLADTAQNGDGQYFTATTADELDDQLEAALEDIVLRNGAFTAAAVPTFLNSLDNGFYTAFFEPRPGNELYRGHIQAYRLDGDLGLVGTDGLSPLDSTGAFIEPRTTYFWDAAETLVDPANLPRSLYYTDLASQTRLAFNTANLGAADLALTDPDVPDYPSPPAGPFANAEQLADAFVLYVSGEDVFDEDEDGLTTELRFVPPVAPADVGTLPRNYGVLGDIFHSSPQLVGGPQGFLASEDGFRPTGNPGTPSFLEQYENRSKVIYAGANDGVLHAFDAGQYVVGDDPFTTGVTEQVYYTVGTGKELFGYVPGHLLPELKKLKQLGAKAFFVDGEATVADAWLPSSATDFSKEAGEWTSALVVGMRNGGRGYLALDVSDPSGVNRTYPGLLWELFDPTEPLGNTWSRPVITRVKLTGSFLGDYCGEDDGDGGVPGNCREEWVAIFGAGYLEQGDPNMPASFLTDPTDPGWEDASKGIFVVSLSDGSILAVASYDGLDAELSNMTFSMPSAPTVLDLDFDGFADVIYIGDTGGQLWKWDISAVATKDSTTQRVPLTTWPVGRFFVSPQASNGHYRSFFFPPSASFVNGELVLAIGTGERTDLLYASTGVDENHFYVIKDPVPTGSSAFSGTPYGIADVTQLNGLGTDPDPNDLGFYLVGQTNEKFTGDPVSFGGFVVTVSYIPDLTSVSTDCDDVGGAAILYVFSLEDGSGFFDVADADAGSDGRALTVGSGLPQSPKVVVVPDPNGGLQTKISVQTSNPGLPPPPEDFKKDNGPPVDLIYWRQR